MLMMNHPDMTTLVLEFCVLVISEFFFVFLIFLFSLFGFASLTQLQGLTSKDVTWEHFFKKPPGRQFVICDFGFYK